MSKDLTLKDVIYALQFGHEHLERKQARGKAEWTLLPSGNRVKQSVADLARTTPGVSCVAQGRDGAQSFGWRSAA